MNARKYLTRILLATLAILCGVSPIFILQPEKAKADVAPTYNHIIPFTITDTGGVARTNVPVIITYDVSGKLVAYGLTNATCTDTYADTFGASNSGAGQAGSSGTPLNYTMTTGNVTAIIPSLPAYGSVTIDLYTGYSPAETSFPLVMGQGGSFSVNNSVSLNITNNWTMAWSGYVDMAVSDNITNKTNAVRIITNATTGKIIADINPSAAISYPIISSNSTGGTSTTVSGVGVTMPAGIASGGLLITIIETRSNPGSTITTPSGWTQLFQSIWSGDTFNTCGVWYKTPLSGSESTTNFTTTSPCTQAWQCFYLASGNYNGVPVAGTLANGSSLTPDPPSLTSGFGAYPTLWIALTGNQGYTTTNAPASYSSLLNTSYSGSAVGTAERYVSTASQDPATFTINASGVWSANTIAVQGSIWETSLSETSGTHTIVLTEDGTNGWLTIDGVSTSNQTATSVPYNTNNWTICSSATPYMTSFQITKGGTLVGSWQPTALITGNSLPDNSGNGNTGTITWGTNSNMTVTAGDIMTSNSATSVATTSVILQGNLFYIGTYASVYLSFQYGLDTTYGYYTSETSAAVAGTFSVTLTGLTPNSTYHYRAVARSGTVYAYGADTIVTTSYSTASLGSITPIIMNGGVFKSYKVAGDMLVTAEVIDTYPPYYPDGNPANYFQLQLLDPTGTNIIGATPIIQWGDAPESIYFNPTVAATLTNQGAYIIKIANISSANISVSTNYTLTATNWYGTDLTKLDAWCVGIAKNMESTNGVASGTYVTPVGNQGYVITDAANAYFTLGIPNIVSIRPNLFATTQTQATITAGGSSNAWDKPDADAAGWRSYVGATIAADVDAMALPFGITGKDAFAGIILIIMLGCVIIMVSQSGGMGALGAFLITIPILWLGTYFRAVPIAGTIILVLIFGMLAIRQFVIKTL